MNIEVRMKQDVVNMIPMLFCFYLF